MKSRRHLVISLGDPCGIGPELLLAGLQTIQAMADVTVVGSKAGVDLLVGRPGAPVTWNWVEATGPLPVGFSGRAYGLQVFAASERSDQPRGPLLGAALWLDPTPEIGVEHLCLGEGSAASGKATVEAIRVAALMTMNGTTEALVTLPMAKSAAHLAGYNIPGHTEFLGDLAGVPITRMAFVSPRLNVVLHTVHQSLRSVVETLDADAVAETLTFSADQFVKLTGKHDLRVALCALNPHAGEQGAFGGEEVILEDALVQAEAAFLEFPVATGSSMTTDASPFQVESPFSERSDLPPDRAPLHRSVGQRGLEILSTGGHPDSRPAPLFFGPLPSDSVFQRAVQGEFDLVVALYHDQGLIPIKLLEPTRAVNLTLGLPFIRTSPDHGTAFDKAGKWIADSQNFIEAFSLAVRLADRAWQSQQPNPSQV